MDYDQQDYTGDPHDKGYMIAQQRTADAVLTLRALPRGGDEPRVELPEGYPRFRRVALLARTRKLTLLDEIAVLRALEMLDCYAVTLYQARRLPNASGIVVSGKPAGNPGEASQP
ncbi:hypothetical protein IAT38_003483 [Cryptococcus sp. DSM 104549]